MKQELKLYSELEFDQVLHLFCSRPDIRKRWGWRERKYHNSPQQCFSAFRDAIIKNYPDSPLNSEESYEKASEWDDTYLALEIKTTKQTVRKVKDLIILYYKQNPTIENKKCLCLVNSVLKKESRPPTTLQNVKNELLELRKQVT